jgi:hypothetical protein
MGTILKLNTKKLGLLHTKRKQDYFCEDSNGHMLSSRGTSEEHYMDQVQMTLARCAHVLDMLDFFGT